jgi:hypothetical protein
MSTRCVINFTAGKEIIAKVYRHCDGYPDGVLPDLQTFFTAVEGDTKDTRFGDPSYLAAKYVVWQAEQYANTYDFRTNPPSKKAKPRLDFLSVGIVLTNPFDIEYEYDVQCARLDSKGRPTVKSGRPKKEKETST